MTMESVTRVNMMKNEFFQLSVCILQTSSSQPKEPAAFLTNSDILNWSYDLILIQRPTELQQNQIERTLAFLPAAGQGSYHLAHPAILA